MSNPYCLTFSELDLADLIRILTEVKHNYVDQYRWLFAQDGVLLDFDADALGLIAQNTLKNKTGARGLHSEIERILMPHMFNLVKYREQGVEHVIITEDLVNNPKELKVENGDIKRKVSNSSGQ